MRLTDSFCELVAYVVYFLRAAKKRPFPFHEVKKEVHRALAQSEQCVKEGAFSFEDYDSARFAVCAWVDEMILASSWEEKTQWQKEPLQRLHYQTADAGEEFFERLNRLGLQQRDVREVYYLCLAMGFKGRYIHDRDLHLLEQLRTSNLKVLMGSALGFPSLEKMDLFPEAYPLSPEEGRSKKTSHRWPSLGLLMVAVPVVFFALLFLIYRFILNEIGTTFLGTFL
jgi:type VI secretion system protein ImpK